MNKLTCPVCFNKSDFLSLSPQLCKTNNFLCKNCGLAFIPREEKRIKDYYSQNGYFKKSPNIAYRKSLISKNLLISESKKRVKDALDIFPLNPRDKKVLDIGCGYGEVLSVFRDKYGSEVTGLEASEEAGKLGEEMFGLTINTDLLEDFETKEKFDLIWSSHVLEHTSDPNTFLKKVQSLLKDKGYFYLEIPNILKPTGGFSLDMFFYEEHVQTFSAYNLSILLKKNGFSVLAYSDSHFLKFWCSKSTNNSIKVPDITAQQVLEFLQNYKKNYNVINSFKVYKQKALYGGKIILNKARDIF